MTINSIFPDEYDSQAAEEEACLGIDVNTGQPFDIVLDHESQGGLSRGGATALSRRLDALVSDWNHRVGRMPHPASLYDSTAEGMAVIARGAGGRPDFIVVLSDQDESAQCIDPHLARALARRLQRLADECEDIAARPLLRRLPDVDEQLRDRDV